MTVAELLSVLGEMDQTDLVVIGVRSGKRSAEVAYLPVADDVYRAVGLQCPVYPASHEIDGEPYNVVIIEAGHDAPVPG